MLCFVLFVVLWSMINYPGQFMELITNTLRGYVSGVGAIVWLVAVT